MARIHHQGVQQSLLHQTTATPPTECTERTEPSCRERTPTDGTDRHRWLWCAVLPRNLAAWVWHGCHTLLICEHPCSSAGGSSLPEGSVCSVRSAGISFLPRMARMNTDGWGALFSHAANPGGAAVSAAPTKQKVPIARLVHLRQVHPLEGLSGALLAWLVQQRLLHPLLNDYGRN